MSLELVVVLLSGVTVGLVALAFFLIWQLLKQQDRKKYSKKVIALDLAGRMKELGRFHKLRMGVDGEVSLQVLLKDKIKQYTLKIPPGADYNNMIKDYGSMVVAFIDFKRSFGNKLYPTFGADVMRFGLDSIKEIIAEQVSRRDQLIALLKAEILKLHEENSKLVSESITHRRKYVSSLNEGILDLLYSLEKEFLTAPRYLREKIRLLREQYMARENVIPSELEPFPKNDLFPSKAKAKELGKQPKKLIKGIKEVDNTATKGKED
ncbi:MAG: hypothetical protein ACTSVY_07400 [Candidatus Helarchaeota archaeon]